MCGICGELRLDGTPVAAGLIESMLPALQRRGPDDAGIWQSGSVALGHRRLSIIDLSSRSHQPMVDAELSLVFNGAIYNYRELRADLQARGHVFVSGGDTEVILKAYREWGVDCPARLHGMFAFAIWDGRRQSLFAARDRFGIKPFYYALDDSRFRFASNTQALLDGGGIDTAIDPVGLHFQYTLHAVIPAPHTILRGIRKPSRRTVCSWMRMAGRRSDVTGTSTPPSCNSRAASRSGWMRPTRRCWPRCASATT